MELFDLTGKVAVITGSSKGIGKAIAERMAEHGARVVISSRKAGPCDEVASAINAKHGEGRAIAIPANIASKEELQRLVDETNAAFGQIDILVCNAATNPYAGPMAGISDDQFGMCYYVSSSQDVTWTEARDKCLEMDANLVEIKTSEKNKILGSLGKK